MIPDDELLRDQIAYYRARAGEYDQWWFRQGRYDRGEAFNAQWHAETAEAEGAFDAWLTQTRPQRVLELACGTGLFTRRIAPHVAHLTAVDASEEVIAINRGRVAAGNVEYLNADLFDWEPPGMYDAVFFSFWLSHIPKSRFGAFWNGVGAALAPGGSAYFIDSAYDASSTARDHPLPNRETGLVTRKLNDGREFRIVKVFWEPGALRAALTELGWTAEIEQTTRYFIHGAARPGAATTAMG